MAREAGHVTRVVNRFVDEVQIEGPRPLDEGQEPALVECEHVEAEESEPEQAHQEPGLGRRRSGVSAAHGHGASLDDVMVAGAPDRPRRRACVWRTRW